MLDNGKHEEARSELLKPEACHCIPLLAYISTHAVLTLQVDDSSQLVIQANDIFEQVISRAIGIWKEIMIAIKNIYTLLFLSNNEVKEINIEVELIKLSGEIGRCLRIIYLIFEAFTMCPRAHVQNQAVLGVKYVLTYINQLAPVLTRDAFSFSKFSVDSHTYFIMLQYYVKYSKDDAFTKSFLIKKAIELAEMSHGNKDFDTVDKILHTIELFLNVASKNKEPEAALQEWREKQAVYKLRFEKLTVAIFKQ